MASVFKPPRKHKRALAEQAALMRQSKSGRSEDPQDADDLDNALELPRPPDNNSDLIQDLMIAMMKILGSRMIIQALIKIGCLIWKETVKDAGNVAL